MKEIIIVCFLAICMSSCSQRFYSSGSNNIPALITKKQVNLGGGFHITERASGLQVQTSGAATSSLGIMVNGHINNVTAIHVINNVRQVDRSKAAYAEAGIGFFLPLDAYSSFETFGGIGLGQIQNSFGSASSRVSNHRYFIQPAFSFFDKDHISTISVALRLSYLNIRMKEFTTSNNYYAGEIGLLQERPNVFFLEPSFQYRVGKKHQGVIQLTLAAPLTSIGYRYDRMNLAIGYNARL